MKYLFLSGGLGNQMFEYAFFLSCKQRGMKIKLNSDLYNVNRMHNGYLLDYAFGVDNDEVSTSNALSVFLTRLLRRYHPCGLVYSDKPMVYDETAFTTNARFFDGCFINPAYFADIQQDVRKAFIFKNIDGCNLELNAELSHCNSVSVHIRRGDYLKNPVYGVCDEAYYVKAMRCIAEKVENPKFFVFSDDTTWCEGFMRKQRVDCQIINHNTGRDSYKDMYLMTRCRHNIIANSTFSWWGAWLNDNKEKIIIAPDKWTTGIMMNDPLEKWTFIEV